MVQAQAATQTGFEIQGLSESEVLARRQRGQGNEFEFKTSRSYGEILRENLFTFFNIFLFGLGLILLFLGKPVEAIITSGTVLINVMVAVVQEVRAKKKLDQIALLTRPQATAIREGVEREIDPSEIVLGDSLVVSPGDQIMVDGQVIAEGQIDVDESLLSGESKLIPKQAGDKVYSGSFCVTGRAVYEVQKVGADSFANELTTSARAFTREYTPLQREVDLMVRVLLGVVVFFGIVLLINFILEDANLLDTVRAASVVFGIAPSSLFLMIVVAYALGAMRIANKGALVQQINSVESLCHVTVLCLDKTGTLTTNRIQLDQIKPINGSSGLAESELRRILGDYAHSVSASNRTNQAIVEACEGQVRAVHEEAPFSSARKWSALSFNENDLRGVYVLGAPEILQPHLEDDSTDEYAAEWAARGLRVLLFAYRPELTPLRDADGEPQLPKDLIPLGLVIFSDELRPEAKETIAEFNKIGMDIKIISGDNPHTVSALAKQAGLEENGSALKLISGPELAELDESQFNQAALDTSIFGRISPHQKEHLVQTLRDNGHYVAMTGDGVNDVLALKRANLGIAMQDGSQATRSVADIVLLNNSFAVLPYTFSEGQRILNGMQDILKLYLTRIIYLTLLIAGIMRVGPGFPFSPKQSSILSIITLAIPAFALALWARKGPVPEGRLIDRLIHFIVPAGITMFAAGLVVYLYFLMTTFDFVYAQHTLTYALILCGLLLIIFVEPPTKDFVGGDELSSDRRPTWLAIGLFLMFLASFMISPVRDFWGLMPLRQYTDYLFIGVVVIFWALALRYIWRARFLEKYLDVDFGGPREF